MDQSTARMQGETRLTKGCGCGTGASGLSSWEGGRVARAGAAEIRGEQCPTLNALLPNPGHWHWILRAVGVLLRMFSGKSKVCTWRESGYDHGEIQD